MARLIPDEPVTVAWYAAPSGGMANFVVDPTTAGLGSPDVEIWERLIPWSSTTPAPPPPKFALVDDYSVPTTVVRTVPLIGGLYQVRLFFKGQGNPEGRSSSLGDLLDGLDFPCLAREGRTDALTRCAEQPQIDIAVGGTFASFAFASAGNTMTRAQLGADPPIGGTATQPAAFDRPAVIAGDVSDAARLLHRLSLTSALLPGNSFFFIVLAWDASGRYDYVWNSTGPAPATPPDKLKAKARTLRIRLAKLHCFDDSDDLSDGEGSFSLVVIQSGAPLTRQFSTSFESGKPVSVPASMRIDLGPEQVTAANNAVEVRVDGAEDDSGFPWLDDDDLASTSLSFSGGRRLAFPVGEGKEEVSGGLLNLPSRMLTSGDEFSFLAEIRFDVSYVS